MSDAGLKHLKGLTQLRLLDLDGTQVSDAGLEHLKGLTQLRDLGLDGTRVSDAGLKHLRGLTQLQELYLCDTKVSDAGLEHLKGLTQLQVSFARWHQGQRRRAGTPQGIDPTRVPGPTRTRVTDAGLGHLKGLTQLRELSVGYTYVTDAGVKDLQKALPKLNRHGTRFSGQP